MCLFFRWDSSRHLAHESSGLRFEPGCLNRRIWFGKPIREGREAVNFLPREPLVGKVWAAGDPWLWHLGWSMLPWVGAVGDRLIVVHRILDFSPELFETVKSSLLPCSVCYSVFRKNVWTSLLRCAHVCLKSSYLPAHHCPVFSSGYIVFTVCLY